MKFPELLRLDKEMLKKNDHERAVKAYFGNITSGIWVRSAS